MVYIGWVGMNDHFPLDQWRGYVPIKHEVRVRFPGGKLFMLIVIKTLKN
jgi:hypothetical protein